MPNNEKNNPINDLPKLNNEKESNNEPKKNIIEIPQEYYDKIEAEKQEKLKKELEVQETIKENREANIILNKIFSLIIVNAIIIFVLLYTMINISEFIIIALPIYIIIFSIIIAFKNKQESNQPVATLIGGMLIAIITFVISMLKEEEMDLWTYYAIASAIIAFLGFITSNIITKVISDIKNIKALQTIGIILYFLALIGIPFYFYKEYPETFYKYVFLKQTEVKAETQDEFIVKTLKNRYNINFICDNTKVEHQINQYSQKITKRTCKDPTGQEIIVNSIAYNEGSNQYTIIDNYIDLLYLNNFKTNLQNEIRSVLSANKILISLYPEKNCTFVGDCVDCDEYFASFEEETNIKNQYINSSKLNLEKYLNLDANSFVEQYKFKYVITLTGNFDISVNPDSVKIAISSILNKLNSLGLKNTYGYDMTFYNISVNGDIVKVYETKGETNQEQIFKEFED